MDDVETGDAFTEGVTADPAHLVVDVDASSGPGRIQVRIDDDAAEGAGMAIERDAGTGAHRAAAAVRADEVARAQRRWRPLGIGDRHGHAAAILLEGLQFRAAANLRAALGRPLPEDFFGEVLWQSQCEAESAFQVLPANRMKAGPYVRRPKRVRHDLARALDEPIRNATCVEQLEHARQDGPRPRLHALGPALEHQRPGARTRQFGGERQARRAAPHHDDIP
ncbi:hypothetical protein D3C85_1118440 [compost metagenome]